MEPLVAIVSSGFVTSGTVDLTKRSLVGIAVPVVNSCALALQGNITTTSADFRRLLEFRSPGSGDLLFATGPGSRMMMLPADFATPPYLRLETVMATGSLQADTRTFTLLTRPR